MRTDAPCCDLGPGDGEPVFAGEVWGYVDAFGFRYRLCRDHYERLLRVFAEAEDFRMGRDWWEPDAPLRRSSGHPRPAPPGAPVATGEEQRRARLTAGWSLRQLAREMDRSYSQVQAAEHGKRPVDPVVAAWVRTVLDEAVE